MQLSATSSALYESQTTEGTMQTRYFVTDKHTGVRKELDVDAFYSRIELELGMQRRLAEGVLNLARVPIRSPTLEFSIQQARGAN
jgi:hypothetical protein